MIQMVIRAGISIGANAIGLLAAAVILDKFEINGASFVIAVAIFSAATVILGPLIFNIARKNAPYLIGGIALVTTFVGLLITDLLSDGLKISGASTWILAALVVWVFSVIGAFFLPWILIKAALIDDPDKPDLLASDQN